MLHQYFKIPQHGGAIRSYYLAKALVEKGVETVVVTTHNEPGYKKQCIEGIEVHFLPIPYDNRFGFNRRVFSFFHFVLRSVKFASRHTNADLCYAISTPLTTGLAALMIRKWYNIPYIFEVGDLWPEAPIKMGFIRNRFLHGLLFRIEKAIYKKANAIVALSPAICDVIQKKVSGKTLHVIPNMSDTDFFIPEQKHPGLEEKFRVKGKFVISYIGAFGFANGLHYFLECAYESQKENLPFHFLMCGDGAMLDSLKVSSKKLSLRNLTILPFQDRAGIAEIMNVTDASFTCYQPVKILETGSPNKYFDGLAAGKLSIINFGGWIKTEIEHQHCGIYVDPKEPCDFVKKVQTFLNDPALLQKYQQAGRSLAEKKYSRRLLGDRFCAVVRGIMQ